MSTSIEKVESGARDASRKGFSSILAYDSPRADSSPCRAYPADGCPAPRTPSPTYYARVNVSAESAFAARLGEQRISYDVSQASPAVVEGAQPKHR